MAERVEELTVAYQEDGVEKVRELNKAILSKGAWATIAFLYEQRNGTTGEYGPTKVTLRRYKKAGGKYMPQSKFNISSAAQAKQLVESLVQWFDFDDIKGGK